MQLSEFEKQARGPAGRYSLQAMLQLLRWWEELTTQSHSLPPGPHLQVLTICPGIAQRQVGHSIAPCSQTAASKGSFQAGDMFPPPEPRFPVENEMLLIGPFWAGAGWSLKRAWVRSLHTGKILRFSWYNLRNLLQVFWFVWSLFLFLVFIVMLTMAVIHPMPCTKIKR